MMSVSPDNDTAVPGTKKAPEMVTSISSAWLALAGIISVITGELPSIVNPELRVTYLPSLLVTVMLRAPVAAVGDMTRSTPI